MERLATQVAHALAQTGGRQGAELQAITAAWPSVVGDAVARQAWPLRVGRDGALHVAASSATWAFELDRMAPEIAARLAAALGEQTPKVLRFRVGPVPEPGSESNESVKEATRELRDAAREVPAEATAAAASAAAAIEDPELRELVARAARASLSRGLSDRGFW
ncbi:MAG: DUF721 domain-containing protein [Actinobacteria bacterium]|nr:DUF721 domain-containing protein [Actinomycetota bacterium]